MHNFAGSSGPSDDSDGGPGAVQKSRSTRRAPGSGRAGSRVRDSEVVERERARVRVCRKIVVVEVGHPARAIRPRRARWTVEVGRDHSPSDGRPRLLLRLRLRLRRLWWLPIRLLWRLAVSAGLHSIVEARKSGGGTDFKQRRPQTWRRDVRDLGWGLSVAPPQILSRPRLQQRCPPTPPPPRRRRSTPRRGTSRRRRCTSSSRA